MKLQHNEVSLELPAGWSDSTQLIATGPAEGPFRPTFTVVREPVPTGTNVGEYAKHHLEVLKQGMPGFAHIRDESAKLQGLSCVIREHALVFNDTPVKQLQSYCVKGSWGYVSTFTQMAARFEVTRKMARTLLDSVSLTRPGPASDAFGD